MITFEEIYGLLSVLGSGSSLLSLIVTVAVLLSVGRLKGHFVARVRLPELLQTLKEHTKDLNVSLKDFESNIREIRAEIKRSVPTLKNVKKKVSREAGRDIGIILNKIANSKNPITRDEAWDIYSELQALILTVDNIVRDIQWEG